MSNYTLSYSEQVQGWPSFYSFNPDWMIGMNNSFYTFKNGNLYKHNTNAIRNNFYGVQYTSKITSVLNDVPLENKLFKTINIEGDAPWSALLQTDIQTSGFIELGWFEKKEQAWFAFVRNSGTIPALQSEYPLRSLNGIGRSTTITGPTNATVVTFSLSPLIVIGGILSIGDALYYTLPPNYDTPVLFGTVTNIIVDYPSGDNKIVVDASIAGATVPPIQVPYIMFIKNAVAESHGVLGHYCVFELETTNTSKVELFAVESQVMKSYP